MMITKIRILVAISLTHLALEAQAPPRRAHNPAWIATTVGQESATLHLLPDDNPIAGNMAVLSCIMTGPLPEMTLAMPFEYVGSITELTDSHFIVCGSNTATPPVGHMVRVEVSSTAGAIIMHESQTYPGRDLFDISWEPTQPLLTAIDIDADEFVFAPFVWPPSNIADPVLPLASLVFQAVGAAQCSALAHEYPILDAEAGEYRIWAHKLANSFRLSLGSGGWVVLPPDEENPNEWAFDVRGSHTAPFRVQSWAPIFVGDPTFQIMDVLNGGVVASGSVASVNSWVSLPSPQNFYDYPGYPHKVVGALSGDSRVLFPLVRYGLPETDPGIVLGPSYAISPSFYLGSSAATFLAPAKLPAIQLGAGLAQPEVVPGYLLIGLGLRYSGAPPDPIVGSGVSARLQFVEALPVSHVQRWRGSTLSSSIQIPNLEFLTDTVVLAQWAMISPNDPNHLVYSDIVGVRVRGANQQALTAGGATQGVQTLSAAKMRRRFRKELRKDSRFLPGMPVGQSALWANRQN